MDATRDLNATIAEAPNHSTLTLPAGQIFECTEAIHLIGKQGFVLDGNGAVILRRDPPTSKAVMSVRLKDCADLIVKNLEVIGSKLPQASYQRAKEGRHGFGLFNCRNVKLDTCQVSHVQGDAVYLGVNKMGGRKAGTLVHLPNRDIVLEEFRADDMGRHAVCAVGVDGLVITAGCSFTNWRRAKIDTEPWAGYRTDRSTIHDLGAHWDKRTDR